MTSKTVRKVIFGLHRYIGLGVGLIALVVGLTGSLLVFHTEISWNAHHKRVNFDIHKVAGAIAIINGHKSEN
ncbi:PepSY-associated TM helix domain-containing protein [Nostoc sp.]|uniref:PepSY-associated TM helix domain-containing protein n=1 Tax=Nostoc sp. TaxID=1180 RepID=UPI002FFA755F